MTFDISFVQSANALERHISAGSRIRKLLLRRYKTFYDEGIDLGNIVVLIGANASGKSNVVSAIDLIARLGGNTASDAVTSIGGVPSVRSGLVEESGSRINVSAAFGQTEVRLGLYLECVRHFEADIEELKRKTKRKATRFTLKGGEQGERILDKKSFYDLIGNMSGSMEKGTNEPFSQRVTFGAYTGLPFWGVEVVGTEARTSIELYGKGERDSDSSVWAETKRFDRPSTLLASELHLHRMRLRGYLPKRIVDYGKEDEIALAGILEDLLSASRVRLAPSDEVDCGIEAIFEDAEGKPLAAADRLRSHFDTLVTPFSTIELPLNSIVSRENQEYIFGLLKETYPEAKEEGFPYLYKEFAAFSTNRRLKEIASKGKRYFDGFNTSPFGDGLLPSSVDLIRPEFNGIKKFDFNPKAMKYFQKSSREHSLRPDGSNIAPFLKTRLSNVEGKERSYFDMRMTKLVPFYRGFEVRSVDFTPECMLFLREGFGPMEDTSEVISSAMNISDGTIVAMGLISALFLDDATTIILEEPERCLNPKNVKAFMEMCEEATTEKQVILTTHNPEAVLWTDIDNVRVVFRDENGFSHVRKPMELDSVRFLIENEVTLDNIFCNDAFGV